MNLTKYLKRYKKLLKKENALRLRQEELSQRQADIETQIERLDRRIAKYCQLKLKGKELINYQ